MRLKREQGLLQVIRKDTDQLRSNVGNSCSTLVNNLGHHTAIMVFISFDQAFDGEGGNLVSLNISLMRPPFT